MRERDLFMTVATSSKMTSRPMLQSKANRTMVGYSNGDGFYFFQLKKTFWLIIFKFLSKMNVSAAISIPLLGHAQTRYV